MKSGEISVGLLWHTLESGNQGVNALTVSNVAFARAAAEALGLRPRFTYFAPGQGTIEQIPNSSDKIVRLNRRTLASSSIYWNQLGELNCMLDISAGDSFADIYGMKRFLWMWGTKRMALARGVPLLLSPQTIGPFSGRVAKRLAAGVMRKARLTVARDPVSYGIVGSLAPTAARALSADVAFRLPFERRVEPRGDGKLLVGVNVSGLLWKQSEDATNRYGLSYSYHRMTLSLLDALAAREDVSIHLITHVVDPTRALDNDAPAVDGLVARYPGARRVPDFPGPCEAKSYISGLDLLIAARMHACIAAFSSGVPVVPVAYSRKFMGLFDELLGYSHTLPPRGYDDDAAVAFVLDRLSRRDQLSRDVEAGLARVAPLLATYDEALRSLFADVAR